MTIYIIVLVAFLSHVGFAGSRLAVPLFAVDQGATPFVVGSSCRCMPLFPAVLALPAGRMTDRLGFKVPIVFGTRRRVRRAILPFVWPSMATLYFTAPLIGLALHGAPARDADARRRDRQAGRSRAQLQSA